MLNFTSTFPTAVKFFAISMVWNFLTLIGRSSKPELTIGVLRSKN